MDYNLVRVKEEEKKKIKWIDKKYLKILKKLMPVFLVSLILPFFVGLVMKPPQIGFFTRADEADTLRIWIEPTTALLKTGESVEFEIYAYFENYDKYVPSISLTVTKDEGVLVSEESIRFRTPLRGRAVIGSFRASAYGQGSYKVYIDKSTVATPGFVGPLEVITGAAEMIVK